MKSSAKNISLNSYDDIFSTEETREDAKREKVTDMPLSELYPFPDHPFQVRDDDSMKETVESIKEYGVLVPAIVRPRADGGYELISGHRRKHACELAGLPTMPVIVRTLDDDAATIIMVDSNIQRENILPSERAKAYKMKLEAIKRQGARTDLTSRQVVGKLETLESAELVGREAGESGRQVQRFIRLNELTPQLQQMVDDKKIAMTPAVELSYLKPEEQTLLLDTIESEQATPSLSQAQRLKKFSAEGHLNEDSMLAIMSEEKKPEKNDLTIKADKLQKYFPKSYTPQQMEQVIIRLLDGWQKKRQRDQER
ncbi:ParB/RepB/Spo0J family partition protein [Caproiciproducens sp. NJN-50]|uniref:ParB/RepB/Spo0J family partition protein n=1 Tax=Caproiciproducens sp. NJN-50 TaxID=2507162 RepID=UPI000FFE0436|nr:ParB/RepB/Spo0J family partition protein [Caproiciproducens sp. NJN-50]QAT48612.1 ParB/RepB/Spo0J family partition protein [Caproiciproducens sp. NJN-50]